MFAEVVTGTQPDLVFLQRSDRAVRHDDAVDSLARLSYLGLAAIPLDCVLYMMHRSGNSVFRSRTERKLDNERVPTAGPARGCRPT